MNVVAIMGRLTADPETRYTQDGMAIAKYTVAIDKPTKEQGADFIPCTAFGKSAEVAEKYFRKGMRVAVNGALQTGSYTNKDGKKVYTWCVAVARHEFAEDKKDRAEAPKEAPKEEAEEGFLSVPDSVIDEELPFI